MPAPKMIIGGTVVVPTRDVSVANGNQVQISSTFYYNMGNLGNSATIINDVGSGSWSSNAVKVNRIERIGTAKLKGGNKQALKPREVVSIGQIGRGTFFGIHSDGTYMSTITGTADNSYVSAGTITPRNYVGYLTLNFGDKTYVIPYYAPTQ